MAKLVDLKRSKAERKKDAEPLSAAAEGNDYPYGLTVDLDHDSMKKLGMHTLPKAGSKLHIHAEAHVKSVRDNQRAGGKRERGMSLELRKMAIAATQKAAANPNVREGLLTGAKAEMDKALDAQEGPDSDGDDD